MSSPLLTPNKPTHMSLAVAEMSLRVYYAAHAPVLGAPIDPSLPPEALEKQLEELARLKFKYADMMIKVGREQE